MQELFFAFIVAMGIQLAMFVPAYLFKTDKLTDMSYGVSFIALALIFLKDFSLPKLILTGMIVVWAIRLVTYLLIRIRKIQKDKRFDGMREDFFKFLGFWLIQGISVFAVMVSSILYLTASTGLFNPIGILVWAIGLLIETFSDLQKYQFTNNPKNKGKWIASGLWKYSRHPNYLGEMLCWIGVYLFVFPGLSSLNRANALISPVFIILLISFVSGIPILEKNADKKWSSDKKYIEYKKKTSVLIPYQGLWLSILLCLSAGFFGSFFTFTSIGSWYSTLNKPFFNPPNWLFGPVWTTLYILIGISLYIAIKNGADKKAIIVFGVQLALNTLWSILFFGLRNPLVAFIEIIILWITILINIILFKKFSKSAAYFLIPYLLWVSFAAVLNFFIVALN
ncbi:MAG: DUF1295 domain-containing protein [archaeon]